MKSIRQFAPYLLAAACLILGGYHLAGVLQTYSQSRDMLSPWEERMKLIRANLPPDVFIVGYLEAADVPNADADPENSEFFMTQYGMAPVVLVKGYGQEWTIGNFGGTLPVKTIKSQLDENLASYTIQDLGFGLYLIHNTGK
jgi:hypothetical protein